MIFGTFISSVVRAGAALADRTATFLSGPAALVAAERAASRPKVAGVAVKAATRGRHRRTHAEAVSAPLLLFLPLAGLVIPIMSTLGVQLWVCVSPPALPV